MPEVAIIVPTYNERKNLVPLTGLLAETLAGVDYEVIFVDDDSTDGTSAAARSLAQHDPHIRIIQRIGRRGLASAAVEGMLAASARFLLVMDADLQHDERVIPAMLEKMKTECLDVVIGTRNAGGGSMGDFAAERVGLSKAGQALSAMVCKVPVSDPMSGFFLLRRSFYLEVADSVEGKGFKILLDMLTTCTRRVRVGEVGYRFRNRQHGKSKLGPSVLFEYLLMLGRKLLRTQRNRPRAAQIQPPASEFYRRA